MSNIYVANITFCPSLSGNKNVNQIGTSPISTNWQRLLMTSILVTFIVFTSSRNVFSQTTIQIGSGNSSPTVGVNPGTGVSGASPYGVCVASGYMGKKIQMIYTASMINDAMVNAGYSPGPCLIENFGWNISSAVGYNFVYQGYTVKMANVSQSEIPNNSTGYYSGTFSNVYGPANHQFGTSTTGWFNMNTTSPFVWDGISNLCVEVCYTLTGVGLISTYGGCQFTDYPGNNHMIFSGGASVTCSTNYGNTSAVTSRLCNMRLGVSPVGPCTGSPVAGVAVLTDNPTGSICSGEMASMDVLGESTDYSGITYQWQMWDGDSFENVTDGIGINSTTYTTGAMNNSGNTDIEKIFRCLIGCTESGFVSASSPVTLTIHAIPEFEISASSSSICLGSTAQLVATSENGEIEDYAWSPQESLSSSDDSEVVASPIETTTYTFSGAVHGCYSTEEITIEVIDLNLEVTPPSATIVNGNSVDLTASASSPNGIISYSWTPSTAISSTNTASVNVGPMSSSTYSVVASDGVCSQTSQIDVTVLSGYAGNVNCGYAYSTGSGFNAISGTLLGANGNNNYTIDLSGISPAFNFNFNGINYQEFGVNGNGFIWLGGTAPPANTYDPISNSTINVEGIISPLAGMPQTVGTVSYLVQGISPQRTLTVYWNGGNTGNAIRFQAVLFESEPINPASDKIVFEYSNMSPQFTTMNFSAQVGLRGTDNSDYLNRYKMAGTMGQSMAATSSGTNNSSAVSFSENDYINANSKIIFTPVISNPLIFPDGMIATCVGGTEVELTGYSNLPANPDTWIWSLDGEEIGYGQTFETSTENAGTFAYTVSVVNELGCIRTSLPVYVVVNNCLEMTEEDLVQSDFSSTEIMTVFGTSMQGSVSGAGANDSNFQGITLNDSGMMTNDVSFKIFPNPNNGRELNLQLPSTIIGNVIVNLKDAMGKLVWTTTFNKQSLNPMPFSFQTELQTGLYHIELISNQIKTSGKMLVIH